MSLSSISNSTLTANQAKHQKAETAVEQSTKRTAGLTSDTDSAKFNDNITLTESVTTSGPGKTAGLSTLEPGSEEKSIKQIMQSIVKNSKSALAAQANIAPQTAQTLLTNE